MSDCSWLVLKTRPKQELRAVANLENQGIQACCPQLEVEKIRRGVRQQKLEPLFPGYVFAYSDNLAADFYKLRSTYGVASVVRFGDNIPMISDKVVQELKTVNRYVAEKAPNVGDKVEVLTGPFKGFIAEILALDGESRCIVMLDWMQHKVKANFSYRELGQ